MKLDKSYKPAVDGYKIYATLGNYRAIPSILFGVQKYLLDKCTVRYCAELEIKEC